MAALLARFVAVRSFREWLSQIPPEIPVVLHKGRTVEVRNRSAEKESCRIDLKLLDFWKSCFLKVSKFGGKHPVRVWRVCMLITGF